ncbi:transposase [Streptomyces sp. NPDC002835]
MVETGSSAVQAEASGPGRGPAADRRGRLLQQLTKRLLESALEGEITDHLRHDTHDPAGRNDGNSRNGARGRTVLTDAGPVETAVPRDRDGTFEPEIVKKRQKRTLARRRDRHLRRRGGLTTGEVQAHLAEVTGRSGYVVIQPSSGA